MKLKSKRGILLFLIFFCIITLPSHAAVTVPDSPPHYVVDLANIIDDPAEAGLNRYLLELEQKTTAQMVVLTIDSLEGESIFDLSLRIAHDKWQLGQKEKDNGVLLLIALQDRKYWTQVGYGLEGVLPDSLVGSIGRQHLVPHFKKQDYSTGVTQAALAIINIIASDAGVEITGMPRVSTKRRDRSIFGSVPVLLFFLYIFYNFIRQAFILPPHKRRYRRDNWIYWGGFGGGFGGGGFGGFGGGGGGGFGGGGAGGGW